MRQLLPRVTKAADLTVWSGFVGSLLIGLGAMGIGWLPPLADVDGNRLLAFLRLSDGGQVTSHLAVIVGGALLFQAWLVFGMQVLTHKARHRSWLALAAWTAPLFLTPPLFSRDVYSYIAQGRLLVAGFNPYEHGVSVLPGWFSLGVDPTWAETPTPYGPAFLGIQWLVAAIVDQSPGWAVLWFRAISIAALAVTAYAVAKLAEHHGIDRSAAVWLSVLNPLMVIHMVSAVHNDSLMIAALALAFWQALEQRRATAVLCLVIAAGIKPIALLALPFIVLTWLPRSSSLRQRVTSLLVAGASTLLALFLSGAALGVGMGWVHALGTPGAVRTLLSPTTAAGQLIGLVAGWVGLDWTDGAITILRYAGMVIAVALIARYLLKPHGASPLHTAAVAFTTLVVLSPVVQPWYLLWALPLVAGAGIRRSWHLRTIVVGTGFFVIYSLTDANIVADSSIDFSDVLSTVSAALAVGAVLLASPAERELALGRQFADGLRPRTDTDSRKAALQVVQADC